MLTSRLSRNLGRGTSVAVLAAGLIAPSEGLWLTAKPDRLARDLPTVCYGMTPHDRKFKIGDKFTPEQCMNFLVLDIPKYQKPIEKCVHARLTNHQWASLVDGSYNAGPGAVCKSPMVKAFNAGDPRACDKFAGWRVTSVGKDGRQVRKGLINRRARESKFCRTPDGDAS